MRASVRARGVSLALNPGREHLKKKKKKAGEAKGDLAHRFEAIMSRASRALGISPLRALLRPPGLRRIRRDNLHQLEGVLQAPSA